MKQTGEYAGVVLDSINPVKVARGLAWRVCTLRMSLVLPEAIDRGLDVVEGEHRPFLLDVQLPLGLPKGGRAAAPFRLTDSTR